MNKKKLKMAGKKLSSAIIAAIAAEASFNAMYSLKARGEKLVSPPVYKVKTSRLGSKKLVTESPVFKGVYHQYNGGKLPVNTKAFRIDKSQIK